MTDPEVDDGWNLIDPHSGEVRDTVFARACAKDFRDENGDR